MEPPVELAYRRKGDLDGSYREISTDGECCSGCTCCALACSFFTCRERVFNLFGSNIVVVPGREQGIFEITLSEDCTHCGICVPYCNFGALSQREGVSHG